MNEPREAPPEALDPIPWGETDLNRGIGPWPDLRAWWADCWEWDGQGGIGRGWFCLALLAVAALYLGPWGPNIQTFRAWWRI
jgi:hypothetical protein